MNKLGNFIAKCANLGVVGQMHATYCVMGVRYYYTYDGEEEIHENNDFHVYVFPEDSENTVVDTKTSEITPFCYYEKNI